MDSAPTGGGKLSADQLCTLTGLTDRRHRQLADAGYFPPPVRGFYQAAPTIKGMFRYLTEQVAKKDDSLAAERKLYTRARREKAETENKILLEKYLPKAEVGPAIRNLGLRLRALLQTKLETELPPKLVGLKPLEIRALCQATVDDLCKT